MRQPPTLLQFGILARAYKGSSLLRDLAGMEIGNWQIRFAGTGASQVAAPEPRISVHDGYLGSAELVCEIRKAGAVALPYQAASQSAVVTLAQSLGRVPIATKVGGIPEQIADGVDGVLLDAGSDASDWRDVLRTMTPADLVRIGSAASERAKRDGMRFRSGVVEICRSG